METNNDFTRLIILDRKPAIHELVAATKAYYSLPNNAAGGKLHIVLDDGNIKDEHIKWCIDYALRLGDNEGVMLGRMLLNASKTQRTKLVRGYEYSL
jgi:hypothetical protein